MSGYALARAGPLTIACGISASESQRDTSVAASVTRMEIPRALSAAERRLCVRLSAGKNEYAR